MTPDGYNAEDEIFPGVFISNGIEACDIQIVDEQGEVTSWTWDEIAGDPSALEAALCAVGIACLKGPEAVRKNIEEKGAILAECYHETQQLRERFERDEG